MWPKAAVFTYMSERGFGEGNSSLGKILDPLKSESFAIDINGARILLTLFYRNKAQILILLTLA